MKDPTLQVIDIMRKKRKDVETLEKLWNVKKKPLISVNKKCNTCKKKNTSSTHYVFNKDGLWFNCTCGSTMMEVGRKAA